MRTIFVGALGAFLAGPALAVPLPTITGASAGTTYNTAALTGFATTGSDMDGSEVTITTGTGGTSPVLAWADTVPGSGAAANAFWSLSLVGDSFSGVWMLTNLAVTSGIAGFRFDGVPGDTTFDIDDGGVASPGSALGAIFQSADGPAGLSLVADYTNRLTIASIFYGDLYTHLSVTIRGGVLAVGESITFRADTDNADASRGGIELPTPASLLLFGLGLGALALRRRG